MRRFLVLLPCLLAIGLATIAVAAEPVDNCASVLGSLAIELRFARESPPDHRTTFHCAKRYTPLVGAERARVLRSLGRPDHTGEDGAWSYYFASRQAERAPGTPELVFRFDGAGLVTDVDCRRTA